MQARAQTSSITLTQRTCRPYQGRPHQQYRMVTASTTCTCITTARVESYQKSLLSMEAAILVSRTCTPKQTTLTGLACSTFRMCDIVQMDMDKVRAICLSQALKSRSTCRSKIASKKLAKLTTTAEITSLRWVRQEWATRHQITSRFKIQRRFTRPSTLRNHCTISR